MAARRLTRRQRLLLRTFVISGVLLVGVAAVLFYRRPLSRYNPEERVEGITAELERRLPPDYPRVTFNEVAREAGISFEHFFGERSTQLPEDMGSGAAWGDYDNDGDEDLFFANIAGSLTLELGAVAQSPAICRLYRNDGAGRFTDVTQRTGLELRVCGMGAAWGDYDSDGLLDLVVTSYPSIFLFHNNGNGTFSDVSSAAGLARFKGFWTGVAWSDYDKDGALDFYVCGYVKYRFNADDWSKVSLQFRAEVPFTLNPSSYEPERNLLFKNTGNGRFIEVAKRLGVDNLTGRSLSASWCDFDDDGWHDLYVANDVSDNAMYRNLGNGRFVDVSHPAWVADYRGAMGLAVGDWDGDGDFDIFVTHWIAQENALFNNMRIAFRGGKAGKMVFMDVADQYGLGQASLDFVKWGTAFLDYDNDGKPDLYVANGSTFEEPANPRKLIPMRHQLFWNRGDPEGFFETGGVSGATFQQKTVGRGAAFADYDNDGDVDIVVINHSSSAWLLRNDGGNQKRWLKVRVRGTKNRFGLGAKVKLTIGGKTQVQQIGSQPSYLSHNSLIAHFGVGEAAVVDEVTVVFPSGRIVQRRAVESNQTVTVNEP
jgi:hypothetical protein